MDSNMIDVYLRHMDSSDGVQVAQVRTAAEVSDLLASMRVHGVYTDGNTYLDAKLQWVLADGDAYAEIIVGMEE